MWIGCGMRTLGVSDTGGAAVVGLGFGQDPVAGGVDHLHAFSGHHVVHHVSAGRQTWSHGLSFNVRYHILVPYRGFAVLGCPCHLLSAQLECICPSSPKFSPR